MIPVLTETITTCIVCGDVACARDLLYVSTSEEAVRLEAEINDVVCRECAAAILDEEEEEED